MAKSKSPLSWRHLAAQQVFVCFDQDKWPQEPRFLSEDALAPSLQLTTN